MSFHFYYRYGTYIMKTNRANKMYNTSNNLIKTIQIVRVQYSKLTKYLIWKQVTFLTYFQFNFYWV